MWVDIAEWCSEMSEPWPDPSCCKVSACVEMKMIFHTCHKVCASYISSVLFQYLTPHGVWIDVITWCSLHACCITLDPDLPADVTVCVWCTPKHYFVSESSYLLHMHEHGPPFLSRTLLVKCLKEVCQYLQWSKKILSLGQHNVRVKTCNPETDVSNS